jgi:glycosyltransferase involved in cell wall biosynthesis
MGSTMKHVLVTSHDFSVTGAPVALWLLLSALAERYGITVVSPVDGPMRERFESAGVKTVVDPALNTDPQCIRNLMSGADCLLANTLLSMKSVIHAAPLGKRIIWYIHESTQWIEALDRRKQMALAALEAATEVITVCEYSRQMYQPWRKEPIKVVPIGIADRAGLPAHEQTSGLRLLMIATIQRIKGHDTALAALGLLDDPAISLRIIGGVSEADFKQACLKIPTGRCPVGWVGPLLDQRRKLLELGACDIVLIPSREEMTPLVAHEAMMAEKLVIASRVGGVPEVIQDGVTGCLVPADSPGEIARLIRSFMDDRERLTRIARAGRQWVRENRSTERWAETCARLIEGEADIEAAIAQATVHSRAGRLAEAEALYRKVLSLHPDSAALNNNLGIVLCRQGRVDEGIEEFRKALVLSPDQPETLNNLNNALKRKNSRAAPAG